MRARNCHHAMQAAYAAACMLHCTPAAAATRSIKPSNCMQGKRAYLPAACCSSVLCCRSTCQSEAMPHTNHSEARLTATQNEILQAVDASTHGFFKLSPRQERRSSYTLHCSALQHKPVGLKPLPAQTLIQTATTHNHGQGLQQHSIPLYYLYVGHPCTSKKAARHPHACCSPG
jgi:hypothetical protein